MSDLPFGFGSQDPRDPDRHRPGEGGQGAPDPANPFGAFGMGGLDVGALGQMLTQLGQMLSQSSAGGGGPVNYDLAKQMAVQKLSTSGLPSAEQATAVADAVHLAELWLDPATMLPSGLRSGAQSSASWAPRDWVEHTLPTWQRLCDPVARQIAGSWIEALPADARQAAGPLVAMVEQMGGLAFGSQLGAALAQLAGEVLTSTDIGLPLGPDGVAALLPDAIDKFATGLERKKSEAMVFLAAREAAHHRLFAHVPWLRQRLLGTVEDFARGIRVDSEALEEMARQVDPSDAEGMERLMRSGLFEPQASPEQKAALTRLEALLALVEGWVDVVVADAVGERLPGADALRETLRRRRASGGPAEQTFATLVGLNCDRESSGPPHRCGASSPSRRASRLETPCGATRICCPPRRTWTILPGSLPRPRPTWTTRSRHWNVLPAPPGVRSRRRKGHRVINPPASGLPARRRSTVTNRSPRLRSNSPPSEPVRSRCPQLVHNCSTTGAGLWTMS